MKPDPVIDPALLERQYAEMRKSVETKTSQKVLSNVCSINFAKEAHSLKVAFKDLAPEFSVERINKLQEIDLRITEILDASLPKNVRESYLGALEQIEKFSKIEASRPETQDIKQFFVQAQEVIEYNKDNPNKIPYYRGLLMSIALRGNPVEFLEPLLRAKEDFAQIDPVGNYRNTTLVGSISNATNDFAAHFLNFAKNNNLDIGIDSRSSGVTALILCAAKGYKDADLSKRKLRVSNSDLIAQMIEFGADPNIIIKKFSVLDVAVARRELGMVNAIVNSKKINLETLNNALIVLKERNTTSLLKSVLFSVVGSDCPIASFDGRQCNEETIKEITDSIVGKKIMLESKSISSANNDLDDGNRNLPKQIDSQEFEKKKRKIPNNFIETVEAKKISEAKDMGR